MHISTSLHRAMARTAVSALALGAILGFGQTSLAQVPPASIGATVSPPSYDLTANQGEILKRTISLSNDASVPQRFQFVVNSFTPSGETGGMAFTGAVSTDLSGWITVNPQEVTLAPNQTASVTVTIKVPSGASPGGHYATVFASKVPTGTTAGSALSTGEMLGVNFLLSVAGNLVESASVIEFSTPNARVSPGQPIDFTVRMKNTGNTHIRPKGVVEIYMGNTKVDELQVNPDGASILPDSIRKFTATSNKTLTPGTYRAELAMTYGNGQTITVPVISFVVIGATSLAAIMAALLGVFVIILLAALMMNRRPMSGRKT